MAEPPREQFMRQAEAALRDMIGPRFWGGSYPNPPTVERSYRIASAVNQHPHVCLLPAPGSRLGGGTQERYEDRFRGVAVGYVASTDEATPATWAERLNWDTKQTLKRLGGSALTAFVEFEDEEDVAVEEQHAQFLLPFTALLADALGGA